MPTPSGARPTLDASLPPAWSLRRPKPAARAVLDLVLAPLRMVALPDTASERLGLTSLRAERFAAVLPAMRGRCLDVGAGDNALLRCYRHLAEELGVSPEDAAASVGVDAVDWGSDVLCIETPARLPFPAASFDTVSFVACINHIPERQAALIEARRVLRPGGRLLVTMIGRFLGGLGHRLWWYSEDKHRDVDEEELMGMDPPEVRALLDAGGFELKRIRRFVYGMNSLYVAEPRSARQGEPRTARQGESC